jgi:hypothetical protein
MRFKGDFIPNIKVLKSERGNLVIVRRPTSLVCPSHYYPCSSCFGFFSKGGIWRHICVGDRSDQPHGQILKNSNMLLVSALDRQSPVLASVLANMRGDEISRAVRNDPLIVKFMDILLVKYDGEKQHIVRQRARELGRLLMHIRKSDENFKDVDLNLVLFPPDSIWWWRKSVIWQPRESMTLWHCH